MMRVEIWHHNGAIKASIQQQIDPKVQNHLNSSYNPYIYIILVTIKNIKLNNSSLKFIR
jgi:hypothetical protein